MIFRRSYILLHASVGGKFLVKSKQPNRSHDLKILSAVHLHHTIVLHYVSYTKVTFIVDVNECFPTNDCMQRCVNTLGSYNCACDQYFERDLSDWRKCKGKCYL